MKSSMRKQILAVGLSLAFAVSQADAAVTDAWITTKAKLALLTTDDVGVTEVNIDTLNGKVTLHGKVPSQKAKESAEATVRRLDGVKGVVNLLQVVPPSIEQAVKIADDDVKKRVEKALAAEPALDGSDIEVRSVNDGVVLLGGEADSLSDHLRAVEIVSAIPGVIRVRSDIQSTETLADVDVWGPGSDGDKAPDITGAARDMWITSATKLRMMADGDAPALDINVDTRDGVVTLFGMVPSQKAKTAAEANARKVSGVKDVRNQIEVVPAKKEEVVQAKDDQIENRLKSIFDDDPRFDGIGVEVTNGVARLTGEVPSTADRFQAALLARATQGVRSVHDDLTIAN